jgi:protein tyrosine phosphatase (PTP) superfamily phosphohydrolase (DUF442 family)
MLQPTKEVSPAAPGRWDRPLDSRSRRVAAYLNMIFVDHGFFRYAYLNLHRFSASAWRSAQPAPHHFAKLAAKGIRTIVSARGGNPYGSLALEREICKELGLKLESFIVYSRDLPSREFLLAAPAFFERLEKPVLFHCKSGADRAGFIAALYLLVQENRPVAEAKRQLHWRFGHFRQAKTGLLDAFFDTYEKEGASKGIAFLEWVREGYDPDAIKRAFRPHWLYSLFNEGLLRRE